MSIATQGIWVKICGTTNLADAVIAVEAGADALGFVFAPSPRQVTSPQVAAITAQLPPGLEFYGVFVDPSFAEVIEAVEKAGLSGVQLHTCNDPTLIVRLRDYFSAQSARRPKLLRVMHYGDDFEGKLRLLEQDFAGDGILVDSRTATAQGGTGVRFNWEKASSGFLRVSPLARLIVAGGLTPENVAEAVATLRPWGVDVVTGVEAAPGRKDPERVRAFVERARSAARAHLAEL